MIALGACLLTAAAIGPAWAEPLSLFSLTPPDPPASGDALGPALDWLHLSGDSGDDGAASRDPRWLRLTASIPDPKPGELRTLLETGERWQSLRFSAAASAREPQTRMTVFGELPYLTSVLHEREASADFSQPAWLRLKGETGGLEAGIEYRSVGNRLARVVRTPAARKDRRGREVWVARRFGRVRLRLSQSQLSDNVDGDLARPRTTEEQTAVTAELAMPSWPMLGLTYAVGDAERAMLSPGGAARTSERHDFERVSGATYYGGDGWELTAASTVSQAHDDARSDGAMLLVNHDLSLSLRPVDAVTVVPALSLGQARYEWSGVQSDTGSASLALTYAPPRSRWFASAFLSYTTTRTSDEAVEARAVSVSGAVGCGLGGLLSLPATLSVEAGYDRYLDDVVPQYSSTGVSVFVLLRVAAF